MKEFSVGVFDGRHFFLVGGGCFMFFSSVGGCLLRKYNHYDGCHFSK